MVSAAVSETAVVSRDGGETARARRPGARSGPDGADVSVASLLMSYVRELPGSSWYDVCAHWVRKALWCFACSLLVGEIASDVIGMVDGVELGLDS